MMRTVVAHEWRRFLGARSSDDAAAELHRLIQRLDDSYDAMNYVHGMVLGSPSPEVEEILSVTRTALNEAIEVLQAAKGTLQDGPEAA